MMNIEDYVSKKSGRGYRVEIRCLNCKDPFWVRWSAVKSGGGKYCSYDCTNKHRYYNDPELENYETRVGSTRHIEVKIICEFCGDDAWVRWQRVQEGMGKFCSKECFDDTQREEGKKTWGKDKAGVAFDKSKGIYYVYWRDAETGKHKTTTFARWWWEINKGKIPDGYRASYKDKNPLNIAPENITLISPEEFGEVISKIFMGRTFTDETKQKMSDAHTGKVLSEEHKLNISNALRKRWAKGGFDDVHIGENSLLWRGGSDEKYPPEFTESLREFIRSRDGYKCKFCKNINDDDRELSVHHIDGNKSNSEQDNLITLCSVCHGHVHGTHKVDDPTILVFRSMVQ